MPGLWVVPHPAQGTHTNQPMHAYVGRTTNRCLSLSLSHPTSSISNYQQQKIVNTHFPVLTSHQTALCTKCKLPSFKCLAFHFFELPFSIYFILTHCHLKTTFKYNIRQVCDFVLCFITSECIAVVLPRSQSVSNCQRRARRMELSRHVGTFDYLEHLEIDPLSFY